MSSKHSTHLDFLSSGCLVLNKMIWQYKSTKVASLYCQLHRCQILIAKWPKFYTEVNSQDTAGSVRNSYIKKTYEQLRTRDYNLYLLSQLLIITYICIHHNDKQTLSCPVKQTWDQLWWTQENQILKKK